MWRSFFTEKKWLLWSWGGFLFIILSLLAQTFIDVKINEYDRLFLKEKPEENDDLLKSINKDSKKLIIGKSEKFSLSFTKGQKVQFQRKGYYIVDENQHGIISFNKTVGLRDGWKK